MKHVNLFLKPVLLIVFTFCTISNLASQNYYQSVSGQVIDAQSKSPVSDAIISIKDSFQYLTIYSDAQGYYSADSVRVGRISVEAYATGYIKQTQSNILITSGKQVQVNFELFERVNTVTKVKVRGNKNGVKNNAASVSARSFNIEDTRRFAGARNDPARMASNFAGVVGNDDSRNDIIIRGNSPLGVLWRLEGVDIPNPNHFGSLGSTGGPVGIINNNTLAKSDFFTGAFPGMYGNATSGVFDLSLKKGNNKKTEFTGQIGFNGFEGGVEGPFSKNSKASYMVYYRYSAVALIQELGLSVGTGAAVPYYQDLVFKVNVPTKKGNLSLYGIGGTSNILFEYDPDDTTNFFNDGNQQVDTRSQMGIVGANYLHRFSKKSYAKLNFSMNTSSLKIAVDTFNAALDPFKVYNDNSKLSRTALHSYYVKKFNARNKLIVGNNSQLLNINFSDSTFDNDINQYRVLRDEEGKTALIQNYVQWQYRIKNNLVLNSGVNHQFFTLNNSQSIEPRLGVTYDYRWKHKFAAAMGLHNQTQPMQLYYVRTRLGNGNSAQTNLDLNFSRSLHFVVSYDYNPSPKWHFKTEAYYQSLDNLPVEQTASSYSAINEGADFNTPSRDSLVNNGTGSNLGAEFTLERYLNKGLYFLSTLSVYDSKYKGSDGVERNTAFNGKYVLNVLGGKEFRINEKHTIALDLRLTSAGGRRFTPINFNASQLQGEEVRDHTKAFENQYKDYFRADFKVTYRMNSKRFTQEWFVDFQNISNNQNVFQEIYNPSQNKVITQYQIGFFPNINYRINF